MFKEEKNEVEDIEINHPSIPDYENFEEGTPLSLEDIEEFNSFWVAE